MGICRNGRTCHEMRREGRVKGKCGGWAYNRVADVDCRLDLGVVVVVGQFALESAPVGDDTLVRVLF